ncbi:MAG: hypothetical protein HUU16_12370 [Candidatus Omnitrophica bacterium]|nr:hypothetical protein [Candidatus Omnitrophota bacterium]
MIRRSCILIVASILCWRVESGSFDEAVWNGRRAQEALARSHKTLHAYLKRLDPVTGLLPRRGGQDAWYVRDSAADLYPFLVMAAWFTDRPVFEREMHAILRNEIRHSTRLGMLSDNVLPGGMGFEFPTLDVDRILFGSAEYMKDGLLPLTELLGHTAWFERMVGMADDLIRHATYETRFGQVPSLEAEVNGDVLQVLARLSWLTSKPEYLDQALRIADFYFKEVIPGANGLPVQKWDLANHRPALDFFNFADHGNEIAGGLAELVLLLKERGHPKLGEYRDPLVHFMDEILSCGLNEDGVWIGSIEAGTRKVRDPRHAHCWGYLFNAVYTTYLITGETRFPDAVRRALDSVTEKPTYLDDPEGSGRKYGSNAYSDAIESAIVFLNRLPSERTFEVLDTCVERFLSRQREDGLIEDWYGDGNYVRTALMYALMKSAGCWIEPWRSDVALGAVRDVTGVTLALSAETPWKGRIRFDRPRHQRHFGMSVNYPRLNEFPEWFVVREDRLYRVKTSEGEEIRSGAELVQGFEVRVEGNDPLDIHVGPLEGPPYGGSGE